MGTLSLESLDKDWLMGKVDTTTVVMGKVSQPLEKTKSVNQFKTIAAGCRYTCQECLDVASDYAYQLSKCSKPKPISMKWIKCFIRQWPEIKVIKTRDLEHFQGKTIMNKRVVMTYDLTTLNSASVVMAVQISLIHNIDDNGISLLHKTSVHFCQYKLLSPDFILYCVTSGKGKTLTIVGAAGIAFGKWVQDQNIGIILDPTKISLA